MVLRRCNGNRMSFNLFTLSQERSVAVLVNVWLRPLRSFLCSLYQIQSCLQLQTPEFRWVGAPRGRHCASGGEMWWWLVCRYGGFLVFFFLKPQKKLFFPLFISCVSRVMQGFVESLVTKVKYSHSCFFFLTWRILHIFQAVSLLFSYSLRFFAVLPPLYQATFGNLVVIEQYFFIIVEKMCQ